MKKAYLSISYQNRQFMHAEIEIIQQTLLGFQIDLFIFVDSYHFAPEQESK